ncbi:unnamed protein product [Ilex paraguariensis]|uniref:Uncharacterized protein n=1 Tax=Ilex paraguariensis TaxID=185542 RepID=A0ABC8RZ10_9AQUA
MSQRLQLSLRQAGCKTQSGCVPLSLYIKLELPIYLFVERYSNSSLSLNLWDCFFRLGTQEQAIKVKVYTEKTTVKLFTRFPPKYVFNGQIMHENDKEFIIRFLIS